MYSRPLLFYYEFCPLKKALKRPQRLTFFCHIKETKLHTNDCSDLLNQNRMTEHVPRDLPEDLRIEMSNVVFLGTF